MTVAELIEKLQALDPEAVVFTSDCCYGLDEEVTVDEILVVREYSYLSRVEPHELTPGAASWRWDDGVIPEARKGVEIS